MLKVILTGLIDYFPVYRDLNFPEKKASELLAIAIKAPGHETLVYTDCKNETFSGSGKPWSLGSPIRAGGRDITIQGGKEWSLDSSGICDPITGWSPLVAMDQMRLQAQDSSPGDGDPVKMQAGGAWVGGRIHLTEGTAAVRTLRRPEFVMKTSAGDVAMHPNSRLGEVVEVRVPLGGSPPVVLIDGEEHGVRQAQDGNYYMFVTNTVDVWSNVCNRDTIPHFEILYELAKNVPPQSKRAVPTTLNGCVFCKEKSSDLECLDASYGPGGGPVRCPGALFNPISTVP